MAKAATGSGKQMEVATYVARIQRLVYQLARLMERCDELCLAQHDITVSQSYTLMLLPPSGDCSRRTRSARPSGWRGARRRGWSTNWSRRG